MKKLIQAFAALFIVSHCFTPVGKPVERFGRLYRGQHDYRFQLGRLYRYGSSQTV